MGTNRRHVSTPLTDFAAGDARFIYAARKDGAPGLVELPDREADNYRAMTRSSLICPVRGCPSPEITTVGGANRHHYRHISKDGSAEHGPETLFHLESKAVIAKWAEARYPDATVELEKVLDGGERIADVMVTLPGGERHAIEVQYSSLTVEKFRERHGWYRAHGIVDTWLFIHAGVQLRTAWDETTHVVFSPTHEAVAVDGGRVLWINPTIEMIGYAHEAVHLGAAQWIVHGTAGGHFSTEPLGDFWLHPEHGMTSARLARMDADTIRAREAVATEKDRLTMERLEQRRRWEHTDAQRRAREAAERELAAGRAHARREFLAAWASSPEAAAARDAFPDGPPVWLDDPGGLDVAVPTRCWRWHLYATHVRDRADGSLLTEAQLRQVLRDQYPGVFSGADAKQAAQQLIAALAREGLIHRAPTYPGWWAVGPAPIEPTAARHTPAVRDTPQELGEHMCEVCGKPMDRTLPAMRAHFVTCEYRLPRASIRSR